MEHWTLSLGGLECLADKMLGGLDKNVWWIEQEGVGNARGHFGHCLLGWSQYVSVPQLSTVNWNLFFFHFSHP